MIKLRSKSRQRRLAKAAAARGARLLDEMLPGWAGSIDLEDLDLSSGRQCVLGQLFEDSVTIPWWQSAGYTSRRAAIKGCINDYGYTREKAEGVCDSVVCDANYTLGRAVIAQRFPRTRHEDADKISEHYGFNSKWDEERDQPVYGFDDLDEAWAQEVQARQKSGLKATSTRKA